MIKQANDVFLDLKKTISREKKIMEEINSFFQKFNGKGDETSIKSQIDYLKFYLNQENAKVSDILNNIYLKKELKSQSEKESGEKKGARNPGEKRVINEKIPKKNFLKTLLKERGIKELGITDLEKDVVKRIEERKIKKAKKKEKGPNMYASTASKMFPEISRSLVSQKFFNSMIQNLLKTNLNFIPTVYISTMLLSTIISCVIGFMIFLFVLIFNVSQTPPFITIVSDIPKRFLETFWILFLIPIGTFIFMYIYPSLERKSLESGINQELPFATINMSAIAGSKIEPTNIFSIIISTGEYPSLKSQFTKVINDLNIYGHDLVTSLRNAASSCPSKKLEDLYNGLATNITSGGDLAQFFEKRSQTLLLDYRLERERSTKSAETFIDIYISIVIAAPMILMLLLVMIQISGLGISMSTTMISVLMVLGVSVINFVFLMFLRLRQPNQ